MGQRVGLSQISRKVERKLFFFLYNRSDKYEQMSQDYNLDELIFVFLTFHANPLEVKVVGKDLS